VLDLLPASGASTADAIRIAGEDVTTATPKQRQALLGRELGYVPQSR
jgi:ABC-type dipeptide/oligopeptide/nickel transport system ATPase component